MIANSLFHGQEASRASSRGKPAQRWAGLQKKSQPLRFHTPVPRIRQLSLKQHLHGVSGHLAVNP